MSIFDILILIDLKLAQGHRVERVFKHEKAPNNKFTKQKQLTECFILSLVVSLSEKF